MANELLGSWKLVSSDNFEEYMKEIGVCFTTRKLAVGLKPDVKISNDGNKWNIKTESTFKNTDLGFVLNELFEETTADGRNCKTTVTLDGGKLIQHQKWDEKGEEKESTITREVQDGQLITICIFGDTKCRRVYDRK